MQNDINDLTATVDKLRADLIATRIALDHVTASLPPAAQKAALQAVLTASTQHPQHDEPVTNPQQQALQDMWRQIGVALQQQHARMQKACLDRQT